MPDSGQLPLPEPDQTIESERGRNHNGTFKKGVSGNPNGRPRKNTQPGMPVVGQIITPMTGSKSFIEPNEMPSLTTVSRASAVAAF